MVSQPLIGREARFSLKTYTNTPYLVEYFIRLGHKFCKQGSALAMLSMSNIINEKTSLERRDNINLTNYYIAVLSGLFVVQNDQTQITVKKLRNGIIDLRFGVGDCTCQSKLNSYGPM